MLNRKLQPPSKLPVSSSSGRMKDQHEGVKALKKFNNDLSIRSNEALRFKRREAGSYMEVASRKLKTSNVSNNALTLDKIKSGISKNTVKSDACTSVRPKIKVARNVAAESSVPATKPFKVKRPSSAPVSDATLEYALAKSEGTAGGSNKIPSDVVASFVAVNSVLSNAVKKRCPVVHAAPFTSNKEFLSNVLSFNAAKRKAKVAEGIPTKLKTPTGRRASTSQLSSTEKQADKSVETPVTFLQKFWKPDDTPVVTKTDAENNNNSNNARSNERFDTRRVLSKLACDYQMIDPSFNKDVRSVSHDKLLETIESLLELNNNQSLAKISRGKITGVSVASNTEVTSNGSLADDGVQPFYIKSQFQSYDSEEPGSPLEQIPFVHRQTDLQQILKCCSDTQTDEVPKLTVQVKAEVVSSGTNPVIPENPPPPPTLVVHEMGFSPDITVTVEMDIQTEEPEPVKKPSTAEFGFTHVDLRESGCSIPTSCSDLDLRKPGCSIPTSCTDLIKGLEAHLESAVTSTTDMVPKCAWKTTSTSKLIETKHFEAIVQPDVATAEVQYVDLEETGDTKTCRDEDVVEKMSLMLGADELIQMQIPEPKQPLEGIQKVLEEDSNEKAARILQELLPGIMNQREQRLNVDLDLDELQASTQTDQLPEVEEDNGNFIDDNLVGDRSTYDEVFRAIQEYGVMKPIDAMSQMFMELATEMLSNNNEPVSIVKDASVGSPGESETDLGRYSSDVMRFGVGGQLEEVSFDEEIIVGSMLSSTK